MEPEEVADPSTWLKANPNLGQTVSYEVCHLDVERAEKAPAAVTCHNQRINNKTFQPKKGFEMEPDFSGYATKAGLKCSDGRTIMPDAFKHQDDTQVPLVWQHGHNSPENVLGHARLENREDGVYAYGFFNESSAANDARHLVQHGDINMLSIWANDLVERSGRVLHGAIREVSLVLSGANPGAKIETVSIRHSDGESLDLDDEAIIYTGIEFDGSDLRHADDKGDDNEDDDKMSIEDVYNTMNEDQKAVLHYMVGEALEEQADSAKHDNVDDADEEGTHMPRNVFDQDGRNKADAQTISHADVIGIVADATRTGSLRDSVESYALAHGITDIDLLFPEAQTLANTPEFFGRRVEWVNGVLSGARKSPFSRIKTMSADLTFDEARAKGYAKGDLKKEEFFGVSRRITTPQTIYKKQKLDRDDIVDITDFDVVMWMKGEMRLMLDEELARAILIGDGRDVSDDDKISETNIRPIAKDHELYTTTVNVNIDDSNSSVQEIIDALTMARQYYRGTGTPTFYTTETYIAKFLLLKDTLGRRIYPSLDALASDLRVASIVAVEVLEDEPDIVGVVVNMADYVIGADSGGQVSMFDDFDIDYNQYKYLIETRVSGALTKLKSAIVVKKVAGALVLVTPTPPTYDEVAGEVTITNTTGVIYKDGDGTVINAAGSPYTVTAGTSYTVNAFPDTGKYFATSEEDSWTFTNPA